LDNKLEQLRRKVTSDSAELVAAEIDHGIAVQQLNRAKQMFSEGIIALTEFERRTAQYNKALALLTEKQQKFQNTKQDITICRIEMSTVRQDAADKIFKAKGEIAAARSEVASTDGEVAKIPEPTGQLCHQGKPALDDCSTERADRQSQKIRHQ